MYRRIDDCRWKLHCPCQLDRSRRYESLPRSSGSVELHQSSMAASRLWRSQWDRPDAAARSECLTRAIWRILQYRLQWDRIWKCYPRYQCYSPLWDCNLVDVAVQQVGTHLPGNVPLRRGTGDDSNGLRHGLAIGLSSRRRWPWQQLPLCRWFSWIIDDQSPPQRVCSSFPNRQHLH